MFNAILTGVPDWSLLPAGTSKELRYLLRGCLERDPGRRFPDGASLRREIERIKGSSDHSNQNKKNRWRYAAVVAVLTLVVIATVRYMRQPQSLQVEDTRQLTLAAGLELDPSLSPDGERLAYALRKLLLTMYIYTSIQIYMRFEWDESKNRTNYRRHGVWFEFEEAQTVWADPRSMEFFDLRAWRSGGPISADRIFDRRPFAIDRFLRTRTWRSDSPDLCSKGDNQGSKNL